LTASARRVTVKRIQIEEMGGNPRRNRLTIRAGRPTLMASTVKI
jgi:hypothetical protein